MRHAIGIVLAAALAAAIFFAASWGYLRLLRLPPAGGSLVGLPAAGGSLFSNHHVLEAVGALLLTGLLAAILIAVPRVSPLAAGLPGLVLLAWTGLYLANVHDAAALIPLRDRAFGTGFEALGINGILAGAGLALVVPLAIPARWRRGEREAVEEFEEDSGLISPGWSPTMPQHPFRGEPG